MAGDVGMCVDVVCADERNDGLCEVTWPALAMLPFVQRDDAPTSSGHVRPPLIGVTAVPRQRPHRDRRLAPHGELDRYLLQLLTPNSPPGDVTRGHVSAEAGDICILDLAQLPDSQIGAPSTLSMAVPRQVLEKAIGSRNLHGTVLKSHGAMTPLIAAVVCGLRSLPTPLSRMQATAAQEALLTLLSAALKDEAPDEVADATPLGTGLRQRIVEFITRNVHVLELSPESLCRRFNVSRAHLYRAFAGDGGVAKVLRDIRLDAAYRELTGAVRPLRSITEIAYSLGFSSGNQLLRSFRARFGMTPSQARASEQG